MSIIRIFAAVYQARALPVRSADSNRDRRSYTAGERMEERRRVVIWSRLAPSPRVSRPGPIGRLRYAEALFQRQVAMVPEKKESHVAEEGL